MKKFGLYCSLLAGLIVLAGFSGCSDSSRLTPTEFSSVVSDFTVPTDSNKVWCYWYWLNDDISREGVTKDLEAMKEVGIGAAFIGNINPNEVNGRVPLFSDEWWGVMVHAVTEGKRLGIDIGTFNCPGWSQSGGPWVQPDMAMRYLTYSETPVTGGLAVTVSLPKPKELFQDVYVLAVPRHDAESKKAWHSGEQLFEANVKGTYTLTGETREIITANSLVLYPAKNTLKADCEIYAYQDGEFKLIRSFVYDRSNNGLNVGPDPYGPVAIALPGVKSDRFKLVVKNLKSNVPMAGFADVVVTGDVVLERYVEKQLGKMHPTPLPYWDTYLWETQDNGSQSEEGGIQRDSIIDVSEHLGSDDTLRWDAPKGEWTVMRFGMSPTGTMNSPAAPQGKGYEIDKASDKLVRFHFENYLGEFIKRIPVESRPALKYVIADSYEMGSQNWTDGYAEKFIKKYGYDPKKYFPVLSGKIVGSVEESERFLWDLRRAIADDIAYEYVGGLRKISEENGLKTWLENYGHWGFPSEFLMYGGQSSLVGGEFWNEGELGNIECKAASSAAHIYGKPVTSAEGFTAAGNAYGRYPALLKRRGDWAFTEGINHIVAHVYIHQPDDTRMPGINAWFSTEFNRHNTWFKQSRIWFDYIRRCQHLLQQGKYAADVCYFIGEDAPKMTGARIPELPSGYSYDYINAEVILNRLKVHNGRFVLPDGMSYRLMVLPPLKTMRPEVLLRLSELVARGGVILGPRPEKSPSLKKYPICDDEVVDLANRLWGRKVGTRRNEAERIGTNRKMTKDEGTNRKIEGEKEGKVREVGAGWVMHDMGVKEALDLIDVAEDFDAGGEYPVLWTHRTQPGMEIYFITNQGQERIQFAPSFRTTAGKPQLWDAVSGSIRLLNDYSVSEGRTTVPLTMEPGQSWFVVFTDQADGITDRGMKTNFPEKTLIKEVAGPWTLTFANTLYGPAKPVTMNTLTDLSQSDNDSIRYYSGTITYVTQIQLDKLPEAPEVYLDLGEVKVIAHVKINGYDAGGLWMRPWTLPVKEFLQPGVNTIEIEVANLWRNRLIYDSRMPVSERKTYLTVWDMRPDEQPPGSGLLGPVQILW